MSFSIVSLMIAPKPSAILGKQILDSNLEVDMSRVVHFEIPADDPKRSIKFYETEFGWTIEKWDGPIEY